MNTLVEKIKKCFGKNADITYQKVMSSNKSATLIFIKCMVDNKLLNSGIMEEVSSFLDGNNGGAKGLCNNLKMFGNIIEKSKTQVSQIVSQILSGSLIVCLDDDDNVVALSMKGVEKRAIAEPPTAAVIKGPREGFVEDINTNLGLIRKRLKTPDFSVIKTNMGKRTQTEIAICYIKGIADKEIVQDILKKLKSIEIDGIIDSYYVQNMLESKNNKIFKQVGNTEKPDVAVAKMLEGRIVLIVDGSPIVLTVPFILLESLQTADDYYMFSVKASYVRVIRFLGLIIAISLPGIYVALQSYHYSVLPINFLITLMSSIQGISFPPLMEILFVLFLFEILNEASIRMPKYLGMALSVIGALILGNTAVQAGLITPPSIVVVAISGITLYIVPDQANENSLLRVIFTLAGGIAGFFGICLCFMIVTTFLADITSFKSPYLSPYAPIVPQDKQDGLVKKDLMDLKNRPKTIPNHNKIRLKAEK